MQISILGKLYSIKSSQDARVAEDAARLFDQKIKELQSKLGPMPTEKVAVLAGLNLAGEFIELKKEHKNKADVIKSKVKHVFERLDEIEKNQSS